MTADDELANARRTLDKAKDALAACKMYFAHQAAMNAQSHMSERVLYPPIHGAIESVLHGIETFRNAYPQEAECKHCHEQIEDRGYDYTHTAGVQQGKHTCGIEPYGFHAEPIGAPCSDDPANPCNGSRGIEPKA